MQTCRVAQQRIVCQSIFVGTPFDLQSSKTAWRKPPSKALADLPYDIPICCGMAQHPMACRVHLAIRGHSHTRFRGPRLSGRTAHAAGKDPFEFRRGLPRKHPRHKRVLEFVAEKAGWGKALSNGRGRVGRP